MSKAKSDSADELRTEYDFGAMEGGIRGKYLRRYRAGTNLALLDPDVAAAFPTDEAVNDALRVLLKAAVAIKRPRRTSAAGPARASGAGRVSDRPVGKKSAPRR